MTKQLVRLIRAHQQDGKLYPSGTRLRMSVELAKWLITQGVAVDAGMAPISHEKPRPPPMRPCCGRRM